MLNVKTTLKSLSLGLIASMVIFSFSATPSEAGSYEYKEYTVKKGDTLWSITKRELVDAYQWPFVWMENQRINDPDLIFPGQVILIPIRALRPGEPVGPDTVSREGKVPEGYKPGQRPGWIPPSSEPEPRKPEYKSTRRTIAKTSTLPIVSREVIIESGYITKFIPDAGEIQGAPLGRFVYALHDIIYIWTKNDVVPGQKFYVVRKMDEVEHPVTGEKMGWAMKVAGVIETMEAGDEKVKSRVIESFDSIHIGDPLDYYSEVLPPVADSTPRSPEITGNVLSASYRRLISGVSDVIFIDKGMKQGIAVGDMFITLVHGTDDFMNGMVQVLNVRNNTSLAVIHSSEREIVKGDIFRSFFDEQSKVSVEPGK